MQFIFGLVFVLVGTAVAVPLGKQSEERIVGGSEAQRNQFPYQVSYQIHTIHDCGGSILNEEWVLTAAHCIEGNNVGDTRVVAGMLNKGETHQDVQICSIAQHIAHPSYSGYPNYYNDIALLRLATRLRFTNAVKPISLPQPNAEHTGMVTLSGWGRLSFGGASPTTLQYIQMNLLSAQECARNVGVQGLLCTQGNHNAGSCSGDSGGPMAQNGQVIGVASFVHPTCGQLSAYTQVSHFIPWIKQHVSV